MLYSTLSPSSPTLSMLTAVYEPRSRRRHALRPAAFAAVAMLLSVAGVSTASADPNGGGAGVEAAVWIDRDGKPADSDLGIGDHLVLGVERVDPNSPYQIRLVDEIGALVSQAKVMSDAQGRIDSSMVWERSGVMGCTASGEPVGGGDYRYQTFADADAALKGRTFELQLISDQSGVEVSTRDLGLVERTEAYFYFADGTGCLRRNLEHDENLYLAGENLPTDGSPYTFFLIEEGSASSYGDALVDVRNAYSQQPQLIDRVIGETSFLELVWVGSDTFEGDFMGVIRNSSNGTPVLQDGDRRIGGTNPQTLTPDGITISPWDCVDCPPDVDGGGDGIPKPAGQNS